MEHLGSNPANAASNGRETTPRIGGEKLTATAGTAPVHSKRSPLRVVMTVLAGILAVAGVGSLAALLLEAFRGEVIWPGFAAGAFYALPVAFLLMAGLVIDSIVRRRRG